ncbi:MAG: hypothetical protein ACQXXJ_04915 [Candidatus Bathyarchaeia archaeon]|jgi:hypothetical protein
MQFKTELTLLLIAITLFTVSTFCYSYVTNSGVQAALSYPYRAYAFPIVSFGSVLMIIATFSYTKKSKTNF